MIGERRRSQDDIRPGSTVRPHQAAILVMVSLTATIAALQIPLAWRAAAQVDMIERGAARAHEEAADRGGFDGLDHNLVSFILVFAL